MANTIKHQGIVENINGSHLQVRIIQTSACASCSVKGHCTSADTKEQLVDVADANAASYQPGDRVWVCLLYTAFLPGVMRYLGIVTTVGIHDEDFAVTLVLGHAVIGYRVGNLLFVGRYGYTADTSQDVYKRQVKGFLPKESVDGRL